MADRENLPTGDPVSFIVMNEIGIIEQLGRSRFERVLPDSLKLPHFSVLNHLVRLGGEWSPLRLARAFQVTKGTMTNTLQRLEARGLIEIRADPSDGRGKLVSITAEGRRARDTAIATLDPLLADLRAVIPDRDFARALPFLRKLRSYLDRERERPGK